jgi:hypothetical protein
MCCSWILDFLSGFAGLKNSTTSPACQELSSAPAKDGTAVKGELLRLVQLFTPWNESQCEWCSGEAQPTGQDGGVKVQLMLNNKADKSSHILHHLFKSHLQVIAVTEWETHLP